jgi:ribonuclease HII
MARKIIPKSYIAVDEVGRGALAGPLVVCAVVIDSKFRKSKLVKDSKKLSAANRLKVWKVYKPKVRHSFGIVLPSELDKLGMTVGTELAIKRALDGLALFGVDTENLDLLIDGNFKFKFDCVKSTESLIKGDSLCAGISLASIFAKVYRDKIMQNYDIIFPLYNFYSNVGYGSGFHIESIKVNSIVRIHRNLFLRKLYEKNINCRQL